jgi:hypothetical protein
MINTWTMRSVMAAFAGLALAGGGSSSPGQESKEEPAKAPVAVSPAPPLIPAQNGSTAGAKMPESKTHNLIKTVNRKRLIYKDDGWSSSMRYPAPMSPADVVAATVGPVLGTAVSHYQFCSLGGHAVNYNSTFLPRVG